MYDHDAFAADLRRHPNLWTFFPDMPASAGAARQLAYSINQGGSRTSPKGPTSLSPGRSTAITW